MRDFQVLFDHGEHSEVLDPAMAPYGKLGFPSPPIGRPWIYANFVQTIDGIVSLLGRESGGSDIAGIEEDRWLMDLLRAHADGVLLGMGTLREEQRLGRPRVRGPVFRIMDPSMRQLRAKLRRKPERNVFVSERAEFQMSDYAVFDGEYVDVTVLTTAEGARRLEAQRHSPAVEIVAVETAGPGLDLRRAMAVLRDRYQMRYLLCEGGPGLYSGMLSAGLIDEQFLTVAPKTVGRMAGVGQLRPSLLPEIGWSNVEAPQWSWLSCRKVGEHQFHRWRRK